jgi:hypothetical protein
LKREKTFYEKILSAGTLEDNMLSIPKKLRKKVSVYCSQNNDENKKSFLFKEFVFNYKKGKFV